MRIAQIAPLYERVPPLLYGGTERVVSYLTEELVRQGHDVTLFASGDSVTRARLEAISPQALRLDPGSIDQLAHHIVMLERVFRAADCDKVAKALGQPTHRSSYARHTIMGKVFDPDRAKEYLGSFRITS